MKIETDQQIRAQADALPADKHQDIVVGQNQRQHGKHEEIEVSEEAVVAAFVRHVSGGINMDQHADAGDKEQPDAGERIEQESSVGLECSRAALRGISQMSGVAAEPSVENRLIGLIQMFRL